MIIDPIRKGEGRKVRLKRDGPALRQAKREGGLEKRKRFAADLTHPFRSDISRAEHEKRKALSLEAAKILRKDDRRKAIEAATERAAMIAARNAAAPKDTVVTTKARARKLAIQSGRAKIAAGEAISPAERKAIERQDRNKAKRPHGGKWINPETIRQSVAASVNRKQKAGEPLNPNELRYLAKRKAQKAHRKAKVRKSAAKAREGSEKGSVDKSGLTGVVLKVLGVTRPEYKPALGRFVQSVDYAANNGLGFVTFCKLWTDAMRFEDEDAAADWVVTVSPVRPVIEGQEWRPAMAFQYGWLTVGKIADAGCEISTSR